MPVISAGIVYLRVAVRGSRQASLIGEHQQTGNFCVLPVQDERARCRCLHLDGAGDEANSGSVAVEIGDEFDASIALRPSHLQAVADELRDQAIAADDLDSLGVHRPGTLGGSGLGVYDFFVHDYRGWPSLTRVGERSPTS
jgi:hypothetical protein